MANKKISEDSEITTPAANDYFPFYRGSDNYRIDWSNFGFLETDFSNSTNTEKLDTFDGWATPLTENKDSLRIDIGSYGLTNEFHAGAKVLSGVVGAIDVPVTSALLHHAQGIAGYCKTTSTTTAAVGGYFQGQTEADSTIAFGCNALVEDGGFNVNLWGMEIDVNADNASGTVRGLDLTGGSTVQPGTAVGLIINPVGVFESPKIKWTEGIRLSDGAADTGIKIGQSDEGNGAGSMGINFLSKTDGGVARQTSLIQDKDGNWSITSNTNSGVYILNGANEGIRSVGGKVGIGGANSARRLNINGDLELTGAQTAVSATAGAANALPATPEVYLAVYIDGDIRKIPCYI